MTKFYTKICIFFFCLFPFFVLVPEPAFAFIDEFSFLDTNLWSIFQNSGQISTSSGKLVLSSLSPYEFPFLITKNNPFPVSGNFISKINFSFPYVSGYGYGIVYSKYSPINLQSFPVPWQNTTIQIWNASAGKFGIWTTLCREGDNSCSLDGTQHQNIYFGSAGTENEFEIDSSNFAYTLKINGTEIFKSKKVLDNISYIWLGEPELIKTPQSWGSVAINQISVENKDKLEAIVVLPGFGGSWDVAAILNNVPGNNWKIPPFVKNYEGIIQSFKNAGYIEDNSLFVFGYDWRKPLDSLADDLKKFIDDHNLTKVNLIGHSMGGLVARTYAQKYGTDKIEKVLTAGSPHFGVIDMYGLWEGAKVWDGSWWQKSLLEIGSEIYRNPGETKVASIRRNSPSIIDLFPTFQFIDFEGNLKPINSMLQRNNFLETLNINSDSLEGKLTAFWSDDVNETKNKIFTEPRSPEETQEGKWEDGSPKSIGTFGVTTGDGTVTKESATGPFGIGEKMTGWHGDLLANLDNNRKILSALGLDSSFAAASPPVDNRKNAFVVLLRSPGTLEVCDKLLSVCGEALGGIKFPEYKMFILPGYDKTDLVVRVIGTELGNYKLYLGNIDESPDWQIREGNLKEIDQIDSYDVSSQGENIIVRQENTITFEPLINKTYGDEDFEISAKASSGLTVAFETTGNCSLDVNLVKLLGAGNCTITAHQKGNDQYYPATDVSQSFAINKAILKVSVDNKMKEYSDPIPLLTYRTNSNVSGQAKCLTTANRFSAAGEYPIICTQGTLDDSNYDFYFTKGTLTVKKEMVAVHYIAGKKNKTRTNLYAKLIQQDDNYPGDLKLAKVRFEVYLGLEKILTTNPVSVDSKGWAEAEITLPNGRNYQVRVIVDEQNKYWTGSTNKAINLNSFFEPRYDSFFSHDLNHFIEIWGHSFARERDS